MSANSNNNPSSQAIERLKRRQDQFGLFMQAPAAIGIISGPEMVYELANQPYQALVGKSENELLGRRLREIFPELETSLENRLKAVFETGEPMVANEFPIMLDWMNTGTPIQRFLNFIYTPFRDSAGEISGIMIFAIDVTTSVQERKRAKESEEQLRLITDRLPALISYMSASDRRYKFINQAYSKWFGLSRSDIEGKTRAELVDDPSTYSYLEPYEAKAFAGESVSFELKLTKPNGESVSLDTEYLPDRNPETGEIRGLIGVGHDVTLRTLALQEAEKARKDMEQLASELNDAVKSRDEFMSIASHELKTPITSLKLQLQLTKRQLRPGSIPLAPDKLSATIEASLKQVDRLTDLIESLLDVARIRTGRIEYSFSEFDLSAMIDDVVERFSEQIELSGCKVALDCQPGLSVNWDRFRVEQVLVNLLSNAVKYAPGQQITIKSAGHDNLATFSVQDTGPGIPKERQGKIFERFERATASRNISGLGLGLFIANQIVKGHGGKIEVESAVSHGTKFLVEIPAYPNRLRD